ncbi:DNA cytosine methyltransferase [Actinotalea sp. Marseille-Q4924]|uniref:DNA cytosine methyltransferase n=1 Tax=Actinotalea sp. Marseille-Q4924 TaxID=2866571 RepID=UPI001CE47662|nr:DNA cytosine methyltransferase [Actinotalea sp. Marseille-Q4924]
MSSSAPDLAPADGDELPAAALTVLDLFAGAGGISTGLGLTKGFRTVAAVEMDVAAAATYQLNHPDTEVFVGPIQDWLRDAEVPRVDVVVGGPPCQGFSTLGKQDAEDVRNSLWHEYAQTIVRARPKYFVLENVGAFLKSAQYEQLVAATEPGGLLEKYSVLADVLNAADYGAPQARKRVVLIGHRKDLDFPGWPEKKFEGRHRTVGQALRGLAAEVDGIDLPPRTAPVGNKRLPGPFRTIELHLGRNYSKLSLARFALIKEGGNRFQIDDPKLLPPCWVNHRSGSADVMGRLRWDKPSVTIRTEFFKPEKGRYLHPEADRAITHLEAALLQGFPLDYRWVGSKVAIARQIGNAVPIPLAKAIGEQLLSAR